MGGWSKITPPVQIRAEPRTRFLTFSWDSFPSATSPLHCTGTQRCHSGPWLILLPDQAPFPRALCSSPSCSLNSTTSQTNQRALLLYLLPWQRHCRASYTKMWETSSYFSYTPGVSPEMPQPMHFSTDQSWLRWEVRS